MATAGGVGTQTHTIRLASFLPPGGACQASETVKIDRWIGTQRDFIVSSLCRRYNEPRDC